MWLTELKRIYGRFGISKHLPIASALIWSIAVPDGGSQVGSGQGGRAGRSTKNGKTHGDGSFFCLKKTWEVNFNIQGN